MYKNDPKKLPVFFRKKTLKKQKNLQKNSLLFLIKNLLRSKKQNKQDTCTVNCN